MRHTNRPHHGEMPMGSAEYEGFGGHAHQGGEVGYPAIPRAPRAPHFAPAPQYQPAMVTSRGGVYAHNQTGPFAAQHAHGPASSRVPAPAHSLSPVAMASARGAAATGGYAAQDTQEVKARPSAKAGFSILFAGAIIGGLIGAVMHARQTAAEAYVAANVQQVQSKDAIGGGDDNTLRGIMVPPLPAGGSAGQPGALPSLIPGVPSALPPGGDKVAADDTTTSTKGHKAGGKKGAGAGAVAPAGGGRKVAAVDKGAESALEEKPETEKPATKKGKGKNKASDDDGYTVASSGSDKEEKPAEKPTTKKADKGGDKSEKNGDSDTAPKKATKKGGDADAVLRAAMGATENTL